MSLAETESQISRFVIAGRPLPFRDDNPVVDLASMEITEGTLEVALCVSGTSITSEIWEHTIHELESLAAALRAVASEIFPQPIEVATPDSQIGLVANLSCVIELEIGYSLKNPGAQRCTFYCSSQHWGLGDTDVSVQLGLAVANAYGTAVMEPSGAIEFANWLDDRLTTLRKL